jgi:hypothetical protein
MPVAPATLPACDRSWLGLCSKNASLSSLIRFIAAKSPLIKAALAPHPVTMPTKPARLSLREGCGGYVGTATRPAHRQVRKDSRKCCKHGGYTNRTRLPGKRGMGDRRKLDDWTSRQCARKFVALLSWR